MFGMRHVLHPLNVILVVIVVVANNNKSVQSAAPNGPNNAEQQSRVQFVRAPQMEAHHYAPLQRHDPLFTLPKSASPPNAESPFAQAQRRAQEAAQKEQAQQGLDKNVDYNYSALKAIMQRLHALLGYICADAGAVYFQVNEPEAKQQMVLERMENPSPMEPQQFRVEVPPMANAAHEEEFLQQLAAFMAHADANVNKGAFSRQQLLQCNVLKEYTLTRNADDPTLRAEMLARLMVSGRPNEELNALLVRSFAPAVQAACAAQLAASDAISRNLCILAQFFQLGVQLQALLNAHPKYQDRVFADAQKVVADRQLLTAPDAAHKFYIGYGPAYNAYLDAMAQRQYASWFDEAVHAVAADFEHTMTVAAYRKFFALLANANEWALKVIEAA